MDTLILASSSPRRKELLETMGIPFKIHPANCDESIPEGTEAEDASKVIAERKVLSLLERLSEPEKKQFILGADTTVIFSGKIYGKPKSK
ncbi:MAG: Maf family protein [Treponema sp.]|nr:Maf family protein [Treponema sp.]